MVIGQVVRVEVYGGKIVERTVVEIYEKKVVVSTAEEIQKSIDEGRSPRGVGFDLGIVFPL